MRSGGRVDQCLHESAHSVVRQLLLGNLGEMGFKKWGAYSYPVERRPLDEMDADTLSKTAVVVAAGIVAERTLCSDVGNESIKTHAISGDVKQLNGIQKLCSFSDQEMSGFMDEAGRLVGAHETAIRKIATELNRRNKLSGEQVTRLIEKHS